MTDKTASPSEVTDAEARQALSTFAAPCPACLLAGIAAAEAVSLARPGRHLGLVFCAHHLSCSVISAEHGAAFDITSRFPVDEIGAREFFAAQQRERKSVVTPPRRAN